MKKMTLSLFSLTIISVLASCDIWRTPTVPPEPEIRIEQTSEKFDVSTPQDVPLTINNCGGATPKQTSRRASTIKIDGEASLGVNYKILEGKLLARYGIEQQYEVVSEIELEKNKKHSIDITWIEDEFNGFLTTEGATGKASYLIRIPKHANIDITYIDCRYENFIASIEPPIRDKRVLEAIRMGIEYENWPQARKLMADAGYPEGIQVNLLLSRFEQKGSSIESAEIQILVEYLAEIGIWVDPIPKD